MLNNTSKIGRAILATLALGLTGSVGFAADAQYYVNDPLATTVAITDAAGEIAAIEADAFGAPLAAGEAPSRYTGKPYDADLGAFVFPYRNYRPEEGRWMSADPSGFPDGVNGVAYAPNLFSELDPTGLLSIVAGSSRPVDFANSGVNMTGLEWTAETKKGNRFSVYEMKSVTNPPPPIPGPLQYDFTMNCHGYVYLRGYYIDNSSVGTILADEWTVTDEKHAKIVVYGGSAHSVNVTGRNSSGSITSVTGKNGWGPIVTTSLNGTGYSGPKYYE